MDKPYRPEYEAAHKSSIRHREIVLGSDMCGGFFCCRTFPPTEIKDWCDREQTALCPYCGIDSVIGSASGFAITDEFLKAMHDYWF